MLYEGAQYRTQFGDGERFLPEHVLVLFGCVFYVFLAVFCIALLTGVSVLGLAAVFLAKNRFASRVPPPPSCILREIFGALRGGAAGFIDKTGKRPSEKSFRRPLFIEAALSDGLVLHVVSGRRGVAAAACPVGVEKLAARAVGALVGVGAEIIALRLQQVGGQARGGVAVEEGEGGGGAGHGQAAFDGFGGDFAPGGQGVLQDGAEVGVAAEED